MSFFHLFFILCGIATSLTIHADDYDDLSLLANFVGYGNCAKAMETLADHFSFINNGIINNNINYLGTVNSLNKYTTKSLLLVCNKLNILQEVRIIANKGLRNSSYDKYNDWFKVNYNLIAINQSQNGNSYTSYSLADKQAIIYVPQADYEINVIIKIASK